MPDVSEIQIAGKGFTKKPIPKWLIFIQVISGVGIFTAIFASAFFLNDWNWLTEGFSTKNSFMAAAAITISFGIGFWLPKQTFLDPVWGLRNEGNQKFYSGYTHSLLPGMAALVVSVPWIIAFFMVKATFASAPLPTELGRIHEDFPAPYPSENLIPIYFWDYATWFNPDWLDTSEIVLPYEKGPPEKLLSKIFFQNLETHQIDLILNGKRPRSYSKEQVSLLFEKTNPDLSSLPLVFRLEKEAGLGQPHQTLPKLYLMEWAQTETKAIGVPWNDKSSHYSGYLFFWGPQGSVFQVQCLAPCLMSRLLELVFFPQDPKGSQGERYRWTAEKIKKLLQVSLKSKSHSQDAQTARKQEKLLSLYLISLLTLDPRDPEAFFHIGKLAQNKQTILSAIQYGRDLGLEEAKIAELTSRLNQLNH